MHYALSLLLFDGVDGALFGLATPHRVRAVVVRGEAALLLPPPHLQSAPAAAAPQEGGAQCGRIAPRRARSLSPLLIRAAPRRPSEYGPQWLVTLYTHYCTARGCGACSAWSRATHTAQSVHPWCTILLGQKKIGTEKRSRRKRKKGSREEEGKVLRAHRRAHTHTETPPRGSSVSPFLSLSRSAAEAKSLQRRRRRRRTHRRVTVAACGPPRSCLGGAQQKVGWMCVTAECEIVIDC